MSKKNSNAEYGIKNVISPEPFVFLTCFLLFFVLIGLEMGFVNMINTMLSTAYNLMIDTIFYIMAIAVLAGAVSGLLNEFGVISLINYLLSPLMRPVYGMPGASCMGILTTYFSDNPAILTLAKDYNFLRYFKKYQIPALTNIGTAFGMGLIITTFMLGIPNPDGGSFLIPVLIGNLGAFAGSVVSVRLMLFKTKKKYGTEDISYAGDGSPRLNMHERLVRPGSIGGRILASLLEGGKRGVEMGFAIVPGVLVICTLVLILTNGPNESGNYTGNPGEGVEFLPFLAQKADAIISPLFGFSSPEAIAVPITSLGAAGASIGLVPEMVSAGLVTNNDIAVFTAMCMCWSGYLSTHVAMMDSLNFRTLTGHAILCHTIGGLLAGISAHWMYVLISAF